MNRSLLASFLWFWVVAGLAAYLAQFSHLLPAIVRVLARYGGAQ